MATPVRQRLLDTLITITAERGIDELSIREVAAGAGVSIGTVQYYCRTKDQMLLMAFEHVADRIQQRAISVDSDGPVGATMLRGLLECLPMDELRRTESRVYLAFAARSVISSELAEVQRGMVHRLRHTCTASFRLAADRGEDRGPYEPEEAGLATAALVDGLLMHMLTDPDAVGPDQARHTLARHLSGLLEFDAG
ncbi:TetR/AcrR family transcriptional regulator [Arthrobacter castelli]|uniref:TetR/AcrR family transcriptional regulator n=1 Tax=Arthrobacter castelli TaxID=271431 RepID=UPI00041B663F|nr:TetR/AcrR family transcriptional regulator [Arthrobacter castelli]